MRWQDENYVRVYTRDTIDWQVLSFEAQGLMTLILRKVDRAGLARLGRHGKRGVAVLVGHPTRWETIAPALDELLTDGCVRIEGETLVVPNFIEAQEAAQSDAQRKRVQRERDRDLAAAGVAPKADGSRAVTETGSPVTNRDQQSQSVTECHEMANVGHDGSRSVTNGHSELSLAEPPEPSEQKISPPACACDPGAAEPETGPVAPARPGPTHRMTGHQLVQFFGQVRNRVFPHTLPWHTARDARGDAGSFAAMLGPDEIADVEPTMQLALEHIRDGVAGWNKEQHAKDPSFAFGAWKSGFHGLREELHGRGPPVAPAKESKREQRQREVDDWGTT